MSGRTFIVGGTSEGRMHACRAEGLNPRSRDVVLVARRDQLLGYTIGAGDRVLWAHGPNNEIYDLLDEVPIRKATRSRKSRH